jgi:hypothetical protein
MLTLLNLYYICIIHLNQVKMKTIYILLLTSISIIGVSCNSAKLAVSNSNSIELSNENDTIYFQKQPIAKVEHYGWIVDKRDHYTQKIVLTNLSLSDDYSLDVISYVKHMHHNAVIEYRNK